MMHFADAMLSRSAFLRDHCRDLEEYTDPEHPLPISLLSRFGGEIAANFDTISPGEWAMLSAMIEQGLASDDEDVGTAVATGLIEGLIHRAETVEDFVAQDRGRPGFRSPELRRRLPESQIGQPGSNFSEDRISAGSGPERLVKCGLADRSRVAISRTVRPWPPVPCAWDTA